MFLYRLPIEFAQLRDSWLESGCKMPYTDAKGSVVCEKFEHTVCFIGKIGEKSLIIHINEEQS